MALRRQLDKYMAAVDDEGRLRALSALCGEKITESEAAAFRMQSLGQECRNSLLNAFRRTESGQLKLQILCFLRWYCASVGYDSYVEQYLVPSVLLKPCLHPALLRESLRLLCVAAREKSVLKQAHVDFCLGAISKSLESLRVHSETSQVAVIDAACEVLLWLSVTEYRKVKLPCELCGIDTLRVQNLLYVQAELGVKGSSGGQTGSPANPFSKVTRDFQLLKPLTARLSERDGALYSETLIRMFSDTDKAEDKAVYQLNVLAAALLFCQGQPAEAAPLAVFLCEKYFLYDNFPALYAEKLLANAPGLVLHLRPEAFSVGDAIIFLAEHARVSIAPGFIKELLFCAKFSGNLNHVALAADLLTMAGNAEQLREEFIAQHMDDILTVVQQNYDRQGDNSELFERTLWTVGLTPAPRPGESVEDAARREQTHAGSYAGK